MRIAYKLVLGYVMVAALSGATMYFADRAYHKIDRIFDDLSTDTVPEVEALEGLKLSAMRIIASTSESALIEAEAHKGGDSAKQASVERELVATAIADYERALGKYAALIDTNVPDEVESQRAIRALGGKLINISRELIADKQQGVEGEQALEKKEEFERAEQDFLAVVEKALVSQHRQLDENTASMQAAISRAKSLTLVIYSLTLTVSLAIGLYFSRSISRPISQITAASRKIGQGDLNAQIDIRSSDEIGILASAFNKMTADLQHSQVEILAAKNFVDNIIKSMSDVLIVTDMNGVIARTNHAATTLLGYQPEDLMGQHWEKILGGRSSEYAEETLRLPAIAAANNIELLCARADGREVPVLLSASVIYSFDGEELGYVCVGRDITKLKQAETQIRLSLHEKEVLLKEIHHRVKNNMQVISSLLNLQARHLRDPQVQVLFRESQDRVKSMALIHETLYQSDDFGRIAFDEYVQKLVAHLSRAYRSNSQTVEVKGLPGGANLSLDVAVPCGLILNELVTNAFKHAFPGGGKGLVNVALENKGNDFLLVVSDNGIGFNSNTDLQRANSLGLKLVTSLTEQLGGRLECGNNGGATFKVTFPKVTSEVSRIS